MSRCVTIVSRHLRDGHIEVTLLSRCSDLHLVFVWGCFRWKANFPVIIPLYVVDIEVIFDGEVARHDFGSENKRERNVRDTLPLKMKKPSRYCCPCESSASANTA